MPKTVGAYSLQIYDYLSQIQRETKAFLLIARHNTEGRPISDWQWRHRILFFFVGSQNRVSLVLFFKPWVRLIACYKQRSMTAYLSAHLATYSQCTFHNMRDLSSQRRVPVSKLTDQWVYLTHRPVSLSHWSVNLKCLHELSPHELSACLRLIEARVLLLYFENQFNTSSMICTNSVNFELLCTVLELWLPIKYTL